MFYGVPKRSNEHKQCTPRASSGQEQYLKGNQLKILHEILKVCPSMVSKHSPFVDMGFNPRGFYLAKATWIVRQRWNQAKNLTPWQCVQEYLVWFALTFKSLVPLLNFLKFWTNRTSFFNLNCPKLKRLKI